jgi:hypothetical protein
MKIETKLGFERIALDGLLGLLAILCCVLLGLLATVVYHLYLDYGLWVVLLPPGVILFWAFGHVVHGMTNTADIGERTRCNGCQYRFRNIFTEWWHKRRCLPYLTKSV